jgi:SAM-dependent methyltransferase
MRLVEKEVFVSFKRVIEDFVEFMPSGRKVVKSPGSDEELLMRESYRLFRYIEGLKLIAFIEEGLGIHLEGKMVGDFACGFGGLVAALSTRDVCCTGCDFIDYNFGELGRALNATSCQSSANFVVADMKLLPFKNGSFDAIFVNQGIEHLPNLQRFFTAIHRLLNANGVAVLGLIVGMKEIKSDSYYGLPFVSMLPARLRTVIGERIFGRKYPWRVHQTFWCFSLIKAACSNQGLKAVPIVFEETRKLRLIQKLPFKTFWLGLLKEFYWDITLIQKTRLSL